MPRLVDLSPSSKYKFILRRRQAGGRLYLGETLIRDIPCYDVLFYHDFIEIRGVEYLAVSNGPSGFIFLECSSGKEWSCREKNFFPTRWIAGPGGRTIAVSGFGWDNLAEYRFYDFNPKEGFTRLECELHLLVDGDLTFHHGKDLHLEGRYINPDRYYVRYIRHGKSIPEIKTTKGLSREICHALHQEVILTRLGDKMKILYRHEG